MRMMLLAGLVVGLTANAAEPMVLPVEITTLKGLHFTGVHFRGLDPDGVRIFHNDGAAKILMEDMPSALRQQFHFDEAKARSFREGLAANQKELQQKREAKAIEDNKVSAQNHQELAKAAAMRAQEADNSKLPLPTTGRTYTVTEVQAQFTDLDGKVIRIRLLANSASSPEQESDGSLKVFVSGSASYDFVYFPREGAAYVQTFLGNSQGQMTFFALISGREIHITGRGFDQRSQSYTW